MSDDNASDITVADPVVPTGTTPTRPVPESSSPSLPLKHDEKSPDQKLKKLNELVACCHSLANAGFADTPLGMIHQHIHASRRWHHSLVDFLRDDECRRFYPNGLPSVQNLHRLAIFHNKPVRPPKRFICSVHAAHARKRTPHVFREAFSRSQSLQQKLASHAAYANISALLSTDVPTVIEHLSNACPSESARGRGPRFSVKEKLARRALDSYLHQPASRLSRDEIMSLSTTLAACERFEHHTHYRQMLGDLFQGVKTHWQQLNQQIGFSQSILDVMEDHVVTGDIIERWDTECEAFYQLSREAALVSRRVRKLNRLVQRINPCDLETETYLTQSARAIERLSLWRDIATRAAAGTTDMTPRQLLKAVSNTAPSLVELTP